MQDYIVSARKYRPITFQSVVGQITITTTLKNAISNNQLAHAYLFCGPRGVGKTTCARIFAKTINCTNLGDNIEACDQCENCKTFNQVRTFNIHELDAASNNSVEDIRSLIGQVQIPPQGGKYSLYIIDEVHMLSTAAFNAFLKTLEEPPPYAIFILATTEKHKILPTILSRCQIYDFKRIQVKDIAQYLQYIAQQEGIQVESEALNIIAKKADGAMRDALSIFDQCTSMLGKNITYKEVIKSLNVLDYDYYFSMVDAFLKQEVTESLLIFDEILNKGFDGHNFIVGLASHLRDILVCKDSETIKLLEVSDSVKQKYNTQAQAIEASFIISAIEIATQCDINYKQSKNQRLLLEVALIQMCQLFKKKLNTTTIPELKIEPIQEGNFTKQNEAKEEPQTQTQPKPQPTSSLSQHKEIPSSPSSINIKEAMAGNIKAAATNKESTVTQEKTPTQQIQNTFTQEELKQAWKKYTDSIKSENSRLYSTLFSTQPILKENYTVECTLSSSIEEDYFKKQIPSLLLQLRKELQNYSMEITTKINVQKNEHKIYTQEDKFKYLSKKNANLQLFKSKFNLDFE